MFAFVAVVIGALVWLIANGVQVASRVPGT
jgi:hypothetical protein